MVIKLVHGVPLVMRNRTARVPKPPRRACGETYRVTTTIKDSQKKPQRLLTPILTEKWNRFHTSN